MLNESSIIKLSKNTLKRFEHNIEDGVLFLFNVETEEVWLGNTSSNDLIRLIDGQRTLKEIYISLMPLFEGYKYDVVKESFNSIVSELKDKHFLEVVRG